MYAYAHACAPVSAGKSIEERESERLTAQASSPTPQPLTAALPNLLLAASGPTGSSNHLIAQGAGILSC